MQLTKILRQCVRGICLFSLLLSAGYAQPIVFENESKIIIAGKKLEILDDKASKYDPAVDHTCQRILSE
jgi:hypothetical protein